MKSNEQNFDPFDWFDKRAFLFGNQQFDLREDSDEESELLQSQLFEYAESCRELIKKSPSLSPFDYSWCGNANNYRNSIEALYQFYILSILAEISTNHPSYKRIGNIVVRVISSSSINMTCLEEQGWKFIVIATSFLKGIHSLANVMRRLVNVELEPDPDIEALSAYYFEQLGEMPSMQVVTYSDAFLDLAKSMGHYNGPDDPEILYCSNIKRALENEPAKTHVIMRDFTEVMLSYAFFECPQKAIQPGWVREIMKDNNLMRDSKHIDFIKLFIYCDVFTLCHELAHVLEDDFDNSERSLKNELAKDSSAASLYMIANAVLFRAVDPIKAELNPLAHPLSYFLGPASFFCLMQISLMARLHEPHIQLKLLSLASSETKNKVLQDNINAIKKSIGLIQDEIINISTRCFSYQSRLVNITIDGPASITRDYRFLKVYHVFSVIEKLFVRETTGRLRAFLMQQAAQRVMQKDKSR